MFKVLVSNGCRLTCKSLTQHDHHQPFVAKEKEKVVCQEFGHNNKELTVLVPQVLLAEFCDHALTLFYLSPFFFGFSLPYYKLS
jgi:hypothetical protein